MNFRKLKRTLKKATPGIITGAADNDPAGITTYSMSGALFGFSQLWVMVLAAPMSIAVLSMCARIGNLQKQGLTKVMLQHFPKWVAIGAVIILLISNITTIGADILAVAASFELLSGIKFTYWVIPITIFIWYFLVFSSYKHIRKLLLLTVPFLFCYALAAILAKPDWSEVFRGIFLPNFSNLPPGYFMAAVGILGTTLTPYLFFWHTRAQVEEHKTVKQTETELQHEDKINSPGLIFSQLITLFIMIAGGATLFGSGQGIATATDAARALEPVGGAWSATLFAIGIISSGFIALPILAGSTAYALSELLKLKHGSLDDKPRRALGFYIIISLSLIAGVVMMLLELDPIKSLYYSQVLAGLLTPILVFVILVLANKKSVVGTSGATKFENIFGVLAMVTIISAAIMMFV